MVNELPKLLESQLPISALSAAAAVLLALVFGVLVRLIYRHGYKESYDPAFDHVLIFLAPILALVMLLIGSNLALSIGMVGSLSIIRFRNVVKSSRDMVFLFWLIALGLGCGTRSFKLTAIAFAIIGAAMIMSVQFFRKSSSPSYQLVVRGKGNPADVDLSQVLGPGHRLIHSLETPDEWELIYELGADQDGAKTLSLLRGKGFDHVAIHQIP